MNPSQTQFELGPEGTLRSVEDTMRPFLPHARRVRGPVAAGLLRGR